MKRIVVAVVAAASVGACASAPVADGVSAESTPAAAPVTTRSPSDAPRVAPSRPVGFRGSVSPIDAGTKARMTSSWRPGCPVALGALRLLRLTHWDFDGRIRAGELVVHAREAREVLTVFETLFDARFPIGRMELVDVYGADDARSMAAGNTSGFNCRPSAGDPGSWSQHAYGLAIDVNPIQNPYVTRDGDVEPPAGAPFADRRREAAGMIHPEGVVVRAFARIGWEWGGHWSSARDYQHFSATGG